MMVEVESRGIWSGVPSLEKYDVSSLNAASSSFKSRINGVRV